MWSKTYTHKVCGVSIEEIWQVWADVNQWHMWHDDIEYAKLEGRFEAGNKFIIKPKNMSEVTIELVMVELNKGFTDLTKFPLAKMYGEHEFINKGDEIELRTTMRVTGVLSFLWRKLVAEKIVADEPLQNKMLIQRVLSLRNSNNL